MRLALIDRNNCHTQICRGGGVEESVGSTHLLKHDHLLTLGRAVPVPTLSPERSLCYTPKAQAWHCAKPNATQSFDRCSECQSDTSTMSVAEHTQRQQSRQLSGFASINGKINKKGSTPDAVSWHLLV